MKKVKISVMLLMCSTVLTGCSNASNLPEKFKENLDYTFGEYSVGDKEVVVGDMIKWQIKFTDKNGIEQNAILFSEPYGDIQKDHYNSKDEFDKTRIYDFYRDSIDRIADRELWDNVVSKYFELEYKDELMGNNEIILSLSVLPFSLSVTDNYFDFVEGIISSQTGIKLCEENLGSIVSKEYVTARIEIYVKDGADPEAYVEKAKAVLDEFEEYAPQNYSVIVSDSSVGDYERKVYFMKSKLLGEEIDEAEFDDYREELRYIGETIKKNTLG